MAHRYLTDRKMLLCLTVSVLLHLAALSLWISDGIHVPETEYGVSVHLIASSERTLPADMSDGLDRTAGAELGSESRLMSDHIKTSSSDEAVSTDADKTETGAGGSSAGSQTDADVSMTGDRAVIEHTIIPPELRSPICALYPASARKDGIEGTAVFMLEIDVDGNVADAVLQKSSGSKILDRAARSAVLKGAFRPGTSDGMPVRSHVMVEVEFRLDK